MAHKSKRLKSHKPAVQGKPVVQPAAVSPPITAAASLRTAPVKAAAAQEAAVRFAELPYELRRIALFSAFVVVLLIVLWFFLK